MLFFIGFFVRSFFFSTRNVYSTIYTVRFGGPLVSDL